METVVRGALIYLVLLIVVRLSGRRTLSQMTPFDLVLVLIVAETTQQALLGDDFSITNAALLIVTLFSIDIGFTYLKRWFPRLDRLVDGSPTVLVTRGRPDTYALERARVTIDDVLEAARMQQGVERMEQIRFAVLEPGGGISIVPERD